MVKNDMKPYVFKHPDYGTLRVLVVDGVPYYGILDVRFIFDKEPKKLYKAIAISTGEVKSFKILVKPHKKKTTILSFMARRLGWLVREKRM